MVQYFRGLQFLRDVGKPTLALSPSFHLLTFFIDNISCVPLIDSFCHKGNNLFMKLCLFSVEYHRFNLRETNEIGGDG